MVTYTKKAQSGRSMIEMLGVLAIVGVLSAGGIAGYSMAMQSYKTSALTEKVNLIAQQARVLYNGNYADSDVGAKLIAAGMITDLANPFGGDLTVTSADSGTGFTVATDGNIPQEACIKLLRTDWGNSGVFTEVKTASKTFSNVTASTGAGEEGGESATKLPVSAAAAISACSADETITWKFK